MISNEDQFEHDLTMQPKIRFRQMTWEDLDQMRHLGNVVGVYGHTHANLGKLPYDKATIEVETSIRKYREHFGNDPWMMSYPFGQKDDITDDVVKYLREKTAIRVLFWLMVE